MDPRTFQSDVKTLTLNYENQRFVQGFSAKPQDHKTNHFARRCSSLEVQVYKKRH